jgi:GxxExxY protein
MSLASLHGGHDRRTFVIVGAAMEVRRTLGPGFPEQFYREALAAELLRRAVPFERDVAYAVYYKGQALGRSGHIAFLCFDEVLVEVRAAAALADPDAAHVRHCVVASPYPMGLLLNFGWYRLEHRQIWRPDEGVPVGEGQP